MFTVNVNNNKINSNNNKHTNKKNKNMVKSINNYNRITIISNAEYEIHISS